jgi:hypothetical protein
MAGGKKRGVAPCLRYVPSGAVGGRRDAELLRYLEARDYPPGPARIAKIADIAEVLVRDSALFLTQCPDLTQ